MRKKLHHSGQVALVMVLIMTVVSAVAVSLASRSTVETRIQQMNVESTEALLTAQAGLEEAITRNEAMEGSLGEGKDFQVTLSEEGSAAISSEKVNPGETLEINLEGATGVTGVKIYWRPAISGGTPSLFVSDIRADQNVDYAYDTSGSTGFTRVTSGGTLEGVNYNYVSPTVNVVPGDSTKIKVTVLESAAFLGIEPVGGQLPPQSSNFRAVANVASSDQSTVKYGIEYVESKTDQIPAIFDYVLFSGGSIVQ